MKALQLLYISLTVSNLIEAEDFYCNALGFISEAPPTEAPPQLAKLLGVKNIQAIKLRRGNQFLELVVFDPSGLSYPPNSQSNDLWFQHIALVTQDIQADYDRLSRHNVSAISRYGPRLLPGGIIAYKFRDPEGHPLELIQFPEQRTKTNGGIDHSAIVVTNAKRSIDYYINSLGFDLETRQNNNGLAQDELDNLTNTNVDVIAMAPEDASPHLELLSYHYPKGNFLKKKMVSSDIAASRLALKMNFLSPAFMPILLEDGTYVASITDPDGHQLLLFADKQG